MSVIYALELSKLLHFRPNPKSNEVIGNIPVDFTRLYIRPISSTCLPLSQNLQKTKKAKWFLPSLPSHGKEKNSKQESEYSLNYNYICR